MIRQLSPRGRQMVDELAQRYGVGSGAVTAMLHSLIAGGGTMAQFDHPEFGGMGQWTRGGMTMVGDMFDNSLKAKVDGLCSELADLLASEPVLARPTSSQSAEAEPERKRQRLRRREPVCLRRRRAVRLVVAGRPRHARVDRLAERPALRLLPGGAASRRRSRRRVDGLRHAGPPDRRRLAAAERRCIVHLRQSQRAGAGRGSTRGLEDRPRRRGLPDFSPCRVRRRADIRVGRPPDDDRARPVKRPSRRLRTTSSRNSSASPNCAPRTSFPEKNSPRRRPSC